MTDISTYGDLTTRDVLGRNITMLNNTETDADGGRDTTLLFQGETALGANHDLGSVVTSHEGTGADTKGQMKFFINNGTALVEAISIDSTGSVSFPQGSSGGSMSSIDLTGQFTQDSGANVDNIMRFEAEGTGNTIFQMYDVDGAAVDFLMTHDRANDTFAITEDGGEGLTMNAAGEVTISQTLTLSDAATGLDVTNNALIGGTLGVTGAITGGSLTDGTATLASGSLTGAVNVTATGTVTGGTLTDGAFSVTSGAVTGATTINASGAITGGSLTDGTATLASGSLTGAVNLTATGTIQGGTLTDGSFSVTSGAVTGATTINASGAITGGSLTDGTATLASGSLTGAVNLTATGTIQGGTLTDGSFSVTSGAVTGATTINASGAITGGSLTDGTATLASGSLTGAVNVTASGAVTAANFVADAGAGSTSLIEMQAEGAVSSIIRFTDVTDVATDFEIQHDRAADTLAIVETSGEGLTMDATGNVTMSQNLVVTGNFTVNGTTTTVNSTTLQVDDKNIELGTVDTPTDITADGGGITLKGDTDKTFQWDNTNDSWDSSEHMNLATGKEYRINDVRILSESEVATSITGAFYIGDSATNGSWRLKDEAGVFVIQYRSAGTWVTKQSVTP